MVDQLAKVYGVELGYWSRIKLFKAVLLNMALAGASELAVDASVDLFSMDLAGRLSARAGQGVGVGILTARLGIKAVGLLRPLPWHPDRQLKLSAVRKQVVSKVLLCSPNNLSFSETAIRYHGSLDADLGLGETTVNFS